MVCFEYKAPTPDGHANRVRRVLGHEESRSQRSLYRGCSRRSTGQERQRRQAEQLLCHVKTALPFTTPPRTASPSHPLSLPSNLLFLHKHYYTPYPFCLLSNSRRLSYLLYDQIHAPDLPVSRRKSRLFGYLYMHSTHQHCLFIASFMNYTQVHNQPDSSQN